MPILNVPEVGIVTMEAITKRPVVVSTPEGDVIAIRPIMNMVLGVDHRANDGAGGAALLRDIKAWLEGVGPETPIYWSGYRASPMAPIVITGAAGFIGSRVARRLYERGDEVVAIVRDPARADALRDLGVRLVAGDLSDEAEIRSVVAGAGAVIHAAGGTTSASRHPSDPAMYDANVAVTERVLDAAIAEGVGRIVYVSTVNVFGDTKGIARDETFRRDPADGFVSYYDETKYLAHLAAEKRIADGAPIVVVMPGTIYGPGDHSAAGAQLKAAFDGTLHYLALADLGVSPTTSTTWPRGSSPRSTAAGSGRPTCCARRTCAWAKRWRSPRRPADDACRGWPSRTRLFRAHGAHPARRRAPCSASAEPARDRQRVGRRHLLGQTTRRRRPSSGTRRATWRPAPATPSAPA